MAELVEHREREVLVSTPTLSIFLSFFLAFVFFYPLSSLTTHPNPNFYIYISILIQLEW